MEKIAFPFADGMMVQVLWNGKPIDQGNIVTISCIEGIPTMRFCSQGFRPGDTDSYILQSNDPQSESWHRVNRNTVSDICEEEIAFTYGFRPIPAYA